MLTDEQAKAVDQVLARHQDYLERLERRIRANGVREPHPLPKWANHAVWSVTALREHFGQWAKGEGKDQFMGGARQIK